MNLICKQLAERKKDMTTKRSSRIISILALSLAFLFLSVGLLPVAALTYPSTEGVQSALLYNIESASSLLEAGAKEKVSPSSATTLMTALLAYEALNERMSETVTLTKDMVEGVSGYELKAGTKLTVKALFQIMLLRDADDAALALAVLASGNEKSFVSKMNERAKALGMTATNYAHPYSNPSDSSRTTARDTALLASALYASSALRELCGKGQASVKIDSQTVTVRSRSAFDYYNGHYDYLRSDIGGLAVSEAADMLVAYISVDKLTYIAVVFGAPAIRWDNSSESYITPQNNAYETAIKLLDFAKEGFSFRTLMHDYNIVGELPVTLSRQSDTVSVVPARDITCFLPNDVDITSEITYKYSYDVKELRAPVKLAQKVGTVKVYMGDTLLDEVDLVTNHTVSKSLLAELFSMLVYLLLHPVTLLLIIGGASLWVLRLLRAARKASAIKAGQLRTDKKSEDSDH